MSLPDQTNIPTSRRQNDSRAQATTHAPTHPDSASYEQQLTQLNQLIRRRTPLSEIEQWIDRTPLTDEEKSALWLYAWSLTDIAGRRAARANRHKLQRSAAQHAEPTRASPGPACRTGESPPRRVVASADIARSSTAPECLLTIASRREEPTITAIPAEPRFAQEERLPGDAPRC